MVKTDFRSFDGKTAPLRTMGEEAECQRTAEDDYAQHIEKLMESIDDRMELTSRLAALIEEIGAEYKCREKKSFEDMQRLAEKEAGIRLLEKRMIRLTDHIKTYIDYFYTDPCPSDDPLTWGN